jgi:hypothetical protein
MKNNIIYVLIGLCIFCSCRPVRNTTSAYNKFDVQYLGEEGYGKVILKVYASGNSQRECIENAKIIALREILFKGISSENNKRPLIGGPNPEEKYKEFFTELFSDKNQIKSVAFLNAGGNISKNDRMRINSTIGQNTNSSIRAKKLNIGVEIVIDKSSLVTMLQTAKILSN